MTRFIHLFAALALWGVLGGAAILACGAHPMSPGEMPPMAPRPERVDPAAVPQPLTDPASPKVPAPAADPAPPTPGPMPGATIDAQPARPLGPVGAHLPGPIGAAATLAAFSASEQPVGTPDAGTRQPDASQVTSPPDAASAPDAPVRIASDASADSYTPPMAPLPDGSLPADSRLEPGRQRN